MIDKNEKINQLEKRVSDLEEQLNYKECVICYGEGSYPSPSKELDIGCPGCKGSGLQERV